jgi:hypothetical protein
MTRRTASPARDHMTIPSIPSAAGRRTIIFKRQEAPHRMESHCYGRFYMSDQSGIGHPVHFEIAGDQSWCHRLSRSVAVMNRNFFIRSPKRKKRWAPCWRCRQDAALYGSQLPREVSDNIFNCSHCTVEVQCPKFKHLSSSS